MGSAPRIARVTRSVVIGARGETFVKPHVRAWIFVLAIVLAPLLCLAGEAVGGRWGQVGLPLIGIAGAGVYATLAAPEGEGESPRPRETTRPARRSR